MMQRAVLLVLMAGCWLPVYGQIGTLLRVRPDGVISPTNAAATITAVGEAAASAAATATKAAIVQDTAMVLSNHLADVQTVINGLEGVGYIRGYMLDFGVSGAEPNTNVTATIVDFVPGVSNDLVHVYNDIYTFFTESPATFPVCLWTESLGKTNEWNVAASVAVTLTDRLVGDVYYAECYRNTVRVPIGNASAFFRVFAEAVQSQVGAFLPVRNGISPGGRVPLTAVFAAGTNTIEFVGGIRVR